MNKRYLLAAAFLSVWLLSACEKNEAEKAEQMPAVAAHPFEGGIVLAKVEGQPIYEEEIDFTIGRTFSQADQLMMNEDARKKMLDSLVASRAMRLSMQANMDPDAQQDLERKVMAYREELYVKAYLQEHAIPEPVTSAMVEQYYQQNPEKFGGGTRKQFELLVTEQKPGEVKRDLLLADIESIRKTQDWSGSASQWRDRYGVMYQQGELAPGLLDERLEKQINALSSGETSGVILIRGIPHVVRVTSYRTVPAKPLAEVSAEIRTALAALQLRAAIQKITEELLKKSNVEYIDTVNN